MIRADELYKYMTKEAKSKTMVNSLQTDENAKVYNGLIPKDDTGIRRAAEREWAKIENGEVDNGLIPKEVMDRRAAERENERQLENTEMRISGISDVLEATSRTLDLTEIMKMVNESSAGEDIVNVVICGVKRKINFHACLQNSAFRLQFAKLCVREVS